MIGFIVSLAGSKTKAYFYLAILLIALITLSVIGINRFIESSKTDFEKSEPTKWESINTYKNMLIK